MALTYPLVKFDWNPAHPSCNAKTATK